MLHDQFYILCLKNPQPQREITFEERVKVYKEIDKNILQIAQKYGDYSEENLQQMKKKLDTNRESRARMAEVYKNGNKQSDR